MRTEQRRLRLLSSKLRAESSSRETLDAIIDDRTGHDRVEDAIAGLPEISRRALRLAYGDGLSHRQIAELHGRPLGTIKTVIRNGLRSLRSAVGDGAVSRRLRTARAAAGLAPAVERPFTIDPADDVKPAPAGTQAPVVPRLAGVHVVCVDDDVRTRELLEWVLRSAGAWCTICSSAAEARSVLDVVWPDVLVADLTMPGEDGHALMRHVRARAGGRGLQVRALAFTACGREDERARALLAGFSAHLGKPVHPAAVVSAVSATALPQCSNASGGRAAGTRRRQGWDSVCRSRGRSWTCTAASRGAERRSREQCNLHDPAAAPGRTTASRSDRRRRAGQAGAGGQRLDRR